MTTDPDVIAQVRKTLDVLFEPGDMTELRVLGAPGAGIVSGYYSDFDKLARDAAKWDGEAPGIYVCLNPCKPGLLDRSPNRFRTHCKHGDLTHDSDILKRRWLPIDIDPVRPADTSATDQEHFAAIARARVIRSVLAVEGWPEPIVADSGNGAHLLYRADFPNDGTSRDRIRAALVTIAERFSTQAVKIDRSVSNAARIWKLYGTLVCKGQNTPQRPHRRSQLLELLIEDP